MHSIALLLNHTYTYSWDNTRRLENVEAEVQHLREQLNGMHQILVRGDSQSTSMTIVDEDMLSAHQQPALHHTTEHPETPPARRRCSGVEVQIQDEPIIDFVTKGLISVEHAIACFQTWVHI